MITIACPECQHTIELDPEPIIGLQTTCNSCGKDMVVTWLFPISLDYLENQDQILPRQDLSLD